LTDLNLRIPWVPQADRFPADGYAALGEKILDISVAQIESVVQPDGIANDVRRESVALVSIHGSSLSVFAS